MQMHIISGVRIVTTLACISITITQIGLLIKNFEKGDTVWQVSEIKLTKTLTPLVLFCSDPHNFDLKSDLVYKPNNSFFLPIKKLETTLKVCIKFQ